MCRTSSVHLETENHAKIRPVNSHVRVQEREGEKRRGLSAHSPSPRAQHPNPSSRLYERLRPHKEPWRCSMRAGEQWRIPVHNPQAESGGL